MLNLRADWFDGYFGRASVAEMLYKTKQFQGKKEVFKNIQWNHRHWTNGITVHVWNVIYATAVICGQRKNAEVLRVFVNPTYITKEMWVTIETEKWFLRWLLQHVTSHQTG